MKFPYPSRDASPEAWAAFRLANAEHLEALQGVLPDRVRELAQTHDVEDGLIVEARHDRTERILRLVLRCCDGRAGYYDLALTYKDAQITPGDERLLARLARGSMHSYRVDLVRQEVDVAENGGVEHRLEFRVWSEPDVWLAVRCGALLWETASRPDKELPPLPDRFPSGPSDEEVNREDRERIVAAWIAQADAEDGALEKEKNAWAHERLREMTHRELEDGADPEQAWAIILAINARSLSDDARGLLAAGPLEDLLAHHGDAFIERVEEQARLDPIFNDLLGGVWRSSTSQTVWRRVEAARRKVW